MGTTGKKVTTGLTRTRRWISGAGSGTGTGTGAAEGAVSEGSRGRGGEGGGEGDVGGLDRVRRRYVCTVRYSVLRGICRQPTSPVLDLDRSLRRPYAACCCMQPLAATSSVATFAWAPHCGQASEVRRSSSGAYTAANAQPLPSLRPSAGDVPLAASKYRPPLIGALWPSRRRRWAHPREKIARRKRPSGACRGEPQLVDGPRYLESRTLVRCTPQRQSYQVRRHFVSRAVPRISADRAPVFVSWSIPALFPWVKIPGAGTPPEAAGERNRAVAGPKIGRRYVCVGPSSSRSGGGSGMW